MGAILEQSPEMGEYHTEVRRESFYLRGEHNAAWVRSLKDGRGLTKTGVACMIDGEKFEMREDDFKPRGEGWEYRFGITRRHAIHMYPDHCNQGSIELLIEDIPKIRAVLDAVEKYIKERGY